MQKHTPEQIITELRQAEGDVAQGLNLAQVDQKLGISATTFHRWRQQYGGMQVEEAKRIKALEAENARLKRLVAELALDKQMLQEGAKKSGDGRSAASGGRPSPEDLRGLGAACLPRAGSARDFSRSDVAATEGGVAGRRAQEPADLAPPRDVKPKGFGSRRPTGYRYSP